MTDRKMPTTTNRGQCPKCHKLVEIEPAPMVFAVISNGDILMTEEMQEQLKVCGYRLERIQ